MTYLLVCLTWVTFMVTGIVLMPSQSHEMAPTLTDSCAYLVRSVPGYLENGVFIHQTVPFLDECKVLMERKAGTRA